MIVYEVETGITLADVPCNVDYSRYSDKELDVIEIENIPSNWRKCKVVNNELVKMKQFEILELRTYGRFLTEDERQLQKLKPSSEEIKKAENTIEILTLLQEVM